MKSHHSLVLFAATLAATFGLAAVAFGAAPSQTGIGPNTAQLHSYDGLICADCHTMHNSEGGVPNTADGGGPYNHALKFPNYTDVCLSCHREGNNTSATNLIGAADSGWTAPIVMTLAGTDPDTLGIAMPGGDFYWADQNPANGHNPAYTDLAGGPFLSTMMANDPVLTFNPPGLSVAWTEKDWDCHSCHGMHSRFSSSYTAWRQVKRKINGIVHTGNETAGTVETSGGGAGPTTAGYEPILANSRGDIQGTNYVNLRKDGDVLDGADLWAPEGATNHNRYRGGFSSFCSVCHGDFHGGTNETAGATDNNGNTNTGTGFWLRHPTNVTMSGAKYNASIYTKVQTNAQSTNPNPTGYDWKYPLNLTDAASIAANPPTASGAITSNDKIMCLSCHKAHASNEANALRWDVAEHVAFIADGETDSYGDVSNGDNPAYGCNKCHQKGGSVAYVKAF